MTLERIMAKKRKAKISDTTNERKALGLNQADYWERYGVTQSGGSRYESGRAIPRPLGILLRLHKDGKISDKDLAAAREKP